MGLIWSWLSGKRMDKRSFFSWEVGGGTFVEFRGVWVDYGFSERGGPPCLLGTGNGYMLMDGFGG